MRASDKIELGDFQTSFEWAEHLTGLVDELCSFVPDIVIEPTCGTGSFVQAAITHFPQAKVLGFDINREHIQRARKNIQNSSQAELHAADFFSVETIQKMNRVSGPLLFLGNPPWVTNAALGAIEGRNLPRKENSQALTGIEAITGKSNFDISEWMICRMLEMIDYKSGMVAMICKSSVARKILLFAESRGFHFGRSKFFFLNSQAVFQVSVDCGFLLFEAAPGLKEYEIEFFEEPALNAPSRGKVAVRKGKLVANVEKYDLISEWDSKHPSKWRSGVKHDCSKVFELKFTDGQWRNGLGEVVEIEEAYCYPFLKSSDLANGVTYREDRKLIVTQKFVGEATEPIKDLAPKTYQYLKKHEALTARRKSSIYRNKPAFSMFGIGDYSFAPWKVAISGLYKNLNFQKLGNIDGKPILVDDTCYFLPFMTEVEADAGLKSLQSPVAKNFFDALVFWDSKRPITAEMLQRFNYNASPKERDSNPPL